MREILFRGKRVDNGEWVYGVPTKDLKGQMVIVESVFECDEYNYLGANCLYVDENSVGQFTGLIDKNGKKIFEGDILQGSDYPFQNGDGEHNYYAEVVWFENSPAFGFVTRKNPKSSVRGISDGNCDYIEAFSGDLWEVIGNIHDNPKILR